MRFKPKSSPLGSHSAPPPQVRRWRSIGEVLVGADTAAAARARPVLPQFRRAAPLRVRAARFLALVAACLPLGYLFSVMAPERMMPFAAPIIILGMLTIWSIPSGERAPTNLLIGLFVAFFASFVLWPNYLAIALPGLPWVTLLRLIAVPLIVALLICLVASRPFRARMAQILNADPLMWKLLVGLVAIQTLTLPFSHDLAGSINRYVVAQCNLTAVFFVSCFAFSRRGFSELWAYLLLGMMTALCFFGVWEAHLRHVPWGGHIPGFLRIGDEAVVRVLQGTARQASGIYRVQGVQTTSLGFAEMLGLTVPFAVHMMIDRYPVIVRLLAAAFLPLAIYVIVLTDSRLGVVASGGSILFYILVWGMLRWRRHRQSLVGPAIVLAYPLLFAAVILSTFFVGRIRAEVWGNGPQQASTMARQVQWQMAIPKILHNPLGHGIAQSADVLGYSNPAGIITVDSYYISALLDWGVVGFLLFFGMMIHGVIRANRTLLVRPVEREIRLLMPISISIINFVVVKSVLSQDFNHVLVFMMLGAVVALTFRGGQAHGRPADQERNGLSPARRQLV